MHLLKRLRLYKSINTDRDRLSKRFVPLWESALKQQVDSYNFATGSIDEQPVRDAMVKNYVSVGGKFALQTAKQILNIKAHFGPELPNQESIDRIMIALVNREFAEKIVGITETTRNEIERLIQIQLDQGNNPRDVARLIRNEMAGINAKRAITIARTESIGASNAGSDAGAQSLGIPLRKTWQAAFINTRNTHSNASGQVRSFDSPFTVGGFQMRRPHDSSLGAPAGEVVNCRCVSIKEAI